MTLSARANDEGEIVITDDIGREYILDTVEAEMLRDELGTAVDEIDAHEQDGVPTTLTVSQDGDGNTDTRM